MYGIYPKSYQNLMAIFSRFPNIEKVILYGSRAIGNYKEGSDIDITLFGNVDNEGINKIFNEIEQTNIPYLFDISIFKNIKNDDLKKHIKRVGKIFYQKIN